MPTTTMTTEPPPSGAPDRRVPWWRVPPGPLFHLACVATAVGWFVATTSPGWDFPKVLLAAVASVVLAMLWMVRLAGTWRFRGDRRSVRRTMRAFLVLPALALLTGVAVATAVPLRVGFASSRAAFDEQVERWQDRVAEQQAWIDEELGEPMHADELPPVRMDEPERLGRFGVHSLRGDGRWLIVFTSNAPMASMTGSGYAGFVYSPDGRPPRTGRDLEQVRYLDLGDGWFAFTSHG